jgi:proline dehydrogenase
MAKSPARTVRTQSNPIFMSLYATARLEILSAQQGLKVNPTALYKNPSIFIKLSALYARYEPLQQQQAIPQISTKLLCLVKQAKAANIAVTIDAEESERLELSLSTFTN